MKSFNGISNEPEHFEVLFAFHENYTFAENLERLVEATNMIQPTRKRFVPNLAQLDCIRKSVDRAIAFLASNEYHILNDDLQRRVDSVSSEIAIAASMKNVNLRGRTIESLITSTVSPEPLIGALHAGSPLPKIYTANELGDYNRKCGNFLTATDIKTKVLSLSSNPKGYNIDKLLSFLSVDASVYLIYVVAIDERGTISTRLCSMYNCQLLDGTRIMKQWAGRNSRGVTQYIGAALEHIVSNFDPYIDRSDAEALIEAYLNA